MDLFVFFMQNLCWRLRVRKLLYESNGYVIRDEIKNNIFSNAYRYNLQDRLVVTIIKCL